MASAAVDMDGVVAVEKLGECLQFAEDHGINLATLDRAWDPLAIGVAHGGAFVRVRTAIALLPGELCVCDSAAGLMQPTDGAAPSTNAVVIGQQRPFQSSALRKQLTALQSWNTVTSGVLTITNKRVVFTDASKQLQSDVASLNGLHVYSNAVQLQFVRAKPRTFGMSNPVRVAGLLHALLVHQTTEIAAINLEGVDVDTGEITRLN